MELFRGTDPSTAAGPPTTTLLSLVEQAQAAGVNSEALAFALEQSQSPKQDIVALITLRAAVCTTQQFEQMRQQMEQMQKQLLAVTQTGTQSMRPDLVEEAIPPFAQPPLTSAAPRQVQQSEPTSTQGHRAQFSSNAAAAAAAAPTAAGLPGIRSSSWAPDLSGSGKEGAVVLVAALEHGLEALESCIPRLPREEKLVARTLCGKLAAMMDESMMGATQAAQLAAHCPEKGMGVAQVLSDALEAVQSLQIGVSGGESVEVVSRLLSVLQKYTDPPPTRAVRLANAEARSATQSSKLMVELSELQAGGHVAQRALAAVLEHGLEALEHSMLHVPRRDKKAVRQLCEQVESALAELDVGQAMQPAERCDAAELGQLHRALGVVSDMAIGAGMECVGAVQSLLDIWKQCSDPVIGASHALSSLNAAARTRGLDTLQKLPRVVLAEAVAAEVAAMSAAGAIGLDEGRSDGERVSAWLAVFTLGLRNAATAVEAVGQMFQEAFSRGSLLEAAFCGRLQGEGGLAVLAGAGAVVMLTWSFASQLESAASRASAEAIIITANKVASDCQCSTARCQDYLTHMIALSTHKNVIIAAGAASALVWPVYCSGASCAKVYIASEHVPAMLAFLRRTQALGQPAAWWREHSAIVNQDATLISNGAYFCLMNTLGIFSNMRRGSTAWEELLAECIHILKANQEAELSAQPKAMVQALWTAGKVISIAAHEQSRHELLHTSGVVEALTWTTNHSYNLIGTSLAEYTAGPTVALIGRNEGGLTLTRETVDSVLDGVHNFWDTSSTHWRVKAAATAPVTKLVGKALPIVDIVIVDANKQFVLQHKTALDDLVHGLLIDEAHPRRAQDGAAKLQETCALVLQNLALSDIGKGPLRAHSAVMVALRSVASGSGGLSDQARQYASGALFELDAALRQKTKEAAKSRRRNVSGSTQGLTQINTGDIETIEEEDIEHIMISYNWGHQSVIKRINVSLKARGYAVWIDIEKMQGSTVEAMAEAVEQAACVVYCISKAYKESSNCRLEAQYAFQQKKDMVPLIVEEGYSPQGWLGILLGVRLWYGFYGPTIASEAAFVSKMDELCREFGGRGLRS
eukprot:COSAG01_NODE_387_length_17738_cov_14.410171_1_plen_1092_part_00